MTVVEEVEQQAKPEAIIEHDGEHCDSDKEDSGPNSMSKGERKARKMLSKLGLKPVTGFFKMELKRNRQAPLCIREPLVYEIPGAVPTYIIVGPILVDKFTDDMARHAKFLKEAAMRAGPRDTTGDKKAIVGNESGSDPEEIGELNDVDIQLAIEQTGKSRNAVIRQLRQTDGDLIEAIMQLTS